MAQVDTQSLANAFQRALGRPPSKSEEGFLRNFIEKDELSQFEAEELIGGLPEAQQRVQAQQRQEFGQLLGASDEAILGKAQDQIASMFARQGRSGSSGRIAAMANTARDLAIERQRQMAAFAAPQFGRAESRLTGQADASRNRGFFVRQDVLERQRELENFRIQEAFMNRQRRAQGISNLQGALTNAGIGLATRGIGAGIGGKLGGLGGAAIGSGQGLGSGNNLSRKLITQNFYGAD